MRSPDIRHLPIKHVEDENGGDRRYVPAAPAGVPTTDRTVLNGDASTQNGEWQLFVVG